MSTETIAPAGAPPRRRRSGGFAFPAIVVFLVLGGLALVVRSSTAGGVYDMTLTELRAQSGNYLGKDVRVNGRVQAGSFRDSSGGDGVHVVFAIGDASGNTMLVHYRQLLPDAFEEGREVIVQGTMHSLTEIECTRLTVKCPSKYQDENATGQSSQYYQSKKDAPTAAPAPEPAEAAPK